MYRIGMQAEAEKLKECSVVEYLKKNSKKSLAPLD